MAKFKDNATGNVFVFTSAHDIDTMRKHPEYTEVVEESPQNRVQMHIEFPDRHEAVLFLMKWGNG